MKRYLGSLATVLLFGTFFLGMGATARAQQPPPASQQPMEIPAQYPPPPQGGPQQAGPQQQAPTDSGAARVSYIHGDVSTQPGGSGEWVAATLNTPSLPGTTFRRASSRARKLSSITPTSCACPMSPWRMSRISRARRSSSRSAQGLVNYDVLKGNEADVEIDTPNVAIHPQLGEGSYRIQVNSDGETIVDVRKGSAEISTPQGSTHVDKGSAHHDSGQRGQRAIPDFQSARQR